MTPDSRNTERTLPVPQSNVSDPKIDRNLQGEGKSYLSKVSNIKEVKSFKQVALLQSKHVTAAGQEGPDVLQAQELQTGQR